MHPRLAAILLSPVFQRRCTGTALFAYLLIIVLGSIPGARAEIGEYAPGGVLHALAYSGIAGLLFVGKGSTSAHRAIGAVLAVAAMGALDEFIQSFLPYRGASPLDWLVDVSAALVTATTLYFLYPLLTRRPHPAIGTPG